MIQVAIPALMVGIVLFQVRPVRSAPPLIGRYLCLKGNLVDVLLDALSAFPSWALATLELGTLTVLWFLFKSKFKEAEEDRNQIREDLKGCRLELKQCHKERMKQSETLSMNTEIMGQMLTVVNERG